VGFPKPTKTGAFYTRENQKIICFPVAVSYIAALATALIGIR